MKISDIRELTDAEINARITEEKDSLLRMQFNHSISEIENPSKIRLTKKTIARLYTVVRQREMAKGQEQNK